VSPSARKSPDPLSQLQPLIQNVPRRSALYAHPRAHMEGYLSWRGPDVSEDPVGHLRPLLSTRLVPEAEMDAVVDADIDHIGSHIHKPIIGAAFLRGRGVIAINCKCNTILSKKQGECAGQRRRNVVGA